MTKAPLHFDPLDFGFRRFELSFQSLEFFERDLHVGNDKNPDPRRINVYLSRDGDYVTVWSGLFDPLITEGCFNEVKGISDFDVFGQYQTDLFRGTIRSHAEAEVILGALNLDRFLPAQLHVNEQGQLVCDSIPEVEERKATRELNATGLAMIEQGAPGISAEAVHDWLTAEDERPFPDAQDSQS